MNDIVDVYKDLREESRIRRKRNREESPKLLTEHGISFQEKNNGAHLIVTCVNGSIDFWPGTGKWIVRKNHKHGRGVRNLINHIKTSMT